jgi:septum site-determining protein MinD
LTRIISIVSGKGGVGKTTLVANLGALLATKYKKEVIVIDCNLTTSHLSLYLGMYYCPTTINKVLMGESHIYDAIQEHFTGMKVIPASLSLKDIQGVDMTKLDEPIKKLEDKADFIILDVATGLGREAVAALKASNEAIFVTIPYVPSIMDIIRTNQLISNFDVKPLGIVLNMATKESHELRPKEVEGLTEIPVIATIPADKNVYKSLSAKMPVVITNPSSPASRQFDKVAEKVLGIEHGSYSEKGLLAKFSRMFSG